MLFSTFSEVYISETIFNLAGYTKIYEHNITIGYRNNGQLD